MPQKSTYLDFDGGPSAKPAHHAVLDAHRYNSVEFMQREWDRMWTRTWLLAGVESDAADPGDFFVFELGPESIIVTRNREGALTAMYNACQHRGNRILTRERGSLPAFTCPYHGWRYDLEGKLLLVPDADRFEQGTPCDRLSLKPVRVESWAGLVWINMDPDCGPLADFLGVIPEQLEPYHFEAMVLAEDQTVTVDANWKTVIDNFNEQYHVDFIHPQHASFVDCYNAENELWPFGHRRVIVEGGVVNPRYPIPTEVPPVLSAVIQPIGLNPADFSGRVTEVRRAIQLRKREISVERGVDFSAFTDEQLSDVYQYDLFPNIIMTIQADELWIMRPRPHPTDPNRCFFDKIVLKATFSPSAPPPSQGRPEREVLTREDVLAGRTSMNITVDQDLFYLPFMQAGMASRGFTQAWLNQDESRVQHFHDWLDICMAD
jgi:phenylpropionate dioxygenase-like ring-hydroxylating dioxygenase large terminal subunit